MQQVKEGSIGAGVIGREAITLEKLEALSAGFGFELSHKARFADPRFPTEQGDLSFAILRLFHTPVEGGEFRSAPDQDRANN